MTLIEPFDLQNILVYTFAGNWFIFMAIAIIAISILAAKFRMNGYSFGLMLAIFSILMFQWASWFAVLLTVIGGLLIYYTVARLGK